MKNINLKSVLKYLISLAAAVVLLWLSFSKIDLSSFWEDLKSADYKWIILSVLISWLSHWVRAYRWNLLLKPLGYNLVTWRTFLAVMTGYLANIALPRLGEVTRCSILKKTDDVPIATSVGTVVVERLIDLISLIILFSVVLLVEFKSLNEVLDLPTSGDSINGTGMLLLYLALGGLAFLGLAYLIWKQFRARLEKNSLYQKVIQFLHEMKDGLTSVGRLENSSMFWLSTVLIWVLYYSMSYIVVFSLPETSGITPMQGLTLLVVGGIGMSAPVQGGFGTYHILVQSLFVYYGVSENTGGVFAVLLHESQTLAVIFLGSICFYIAMVISRKKNQSRPEAKTWDTETTNQAVSS